MNPSRSHPLPLQNAQWEFEGEPDDDDQSQGASDDNLADDPFTRKELGGWSVRGAERVCTPSRLGAGTAAPTPGRLLCVKLGGGFPAMCAVTCPARLPLLSHCGANFPPPGLKAGLAGDGEEDEEEERSSESGDEAGAEDEAKARERRFRELKVGPGVGEELGRCGVCTWLKKLKGRGERKARPRTLAGGAAARQQQRQGLCRAAVGVQDREFESLTDRRFERRPDLERPTWET
jgi:hypothetical protein